MGRFFAAIGLMIAGFIFGPPAIYIFLSLMQTVFGG